MSSEQLHDFDLAMCQHVLDANRCYLSDLEFTAYVREQLSPAVLQHLQLLEDTDESPSLLSDDELDCLSGVFAGGPFEFDQPWVSHEPLYRRGLDCVTEIRAGLSREHAEQWARASVQFTERLTSGRTHLGIGIEIVRQWVGEARRLRQAMSEVDRVETPGSALPPPTRTEPPAQVATPQDQTESSAETGVEKALAETLKYQPAIR